MLAIALVLMAFGVVSMALHGITSRYVLREKMLTKNETLVMQSGIGALALITYLFVVREEVGTRIDASTLFWGAVAGTTLANLLIQWANVQARAIADASLSAPVQGMTPFLITLSALTISEFPGPQGIAGIGLIAIGTWIHGREKARTFADYLKPFTMLSLPRDYAMRPETEQKQLLSDVRALRYAYLSAAFGTIGLLCDGLVARSGSVALGFAIQLCVIAFVFFIPALREKRKAWSDRPQGSRFFAVALGLFFGLHVLFVMTAFRFAPVAYVGSLKRISIVLTVFLAWWLLGEKKALKRLWPAGIITAGAVLLALDPSSTAIVDASYRALGGQ